MNHRSESRFIFIAANPATILIAGGLLLITLGVALTPLNPATGASLFGCGTILIALGILLHILWLGPRMARAMRGY